MLNTNHDLSLRIIQTLTSATSTQRIRWIRVPDYLFYNGRNKALINYTEMFSNTDMPTSVNDIPKANLLKSYYCEYEGVSFCLMYCTQVLVNNQLPVDFYNLMIQQTPFDNFGYYSTPDKKYQVPLRKLAELAEMQVSHAYTDQTPLYHALEKLEGSIKNFDPTKESVLAPRPSTVPYKHCCVIDANGFYITFVLVLLENSKGEKGEFIQNYKLKKGEKLIAVTPPRNMKKPRWNGSNWEEFSTKVSPNTDLHNRDSGKSNQLAKWIPRTPDLSFTKVFNTEDVQSMMQDVIQKSIKVKTEEDLSKQCKK